MVTARGAPGGTARPWRRHSDGLGPAALTAAVHTVAGIPVFFVGALAVQIRGDLDVSAAGLGAGVAVFNLTAMLSSALCGRLAERLGGTRTMRAAGVACVAVLLVTAAAPSWPVLVAALAVGGIALSAEQPASNIFLARAVPAGRWGTAFAIKQTGLPMASMLGGLAVPALALTVGWRWAYVGAAALALGVVFAVPRDAPSPERRSAPRQDAGGDAPIGGLIVLSAAIALAAAAMTSLAAFFVSSAQAEQFSAGAAGLLLTVGGLVSVLVRLVLGARFDVRGGSSLPAVAVMLGIGALAMVLFAAGPPLAFVVATPLAFGSAMAIGGLFMLAVVRSSPGRPGVATGITQTGTYLGGVIGPVAFGAVVEATSYRVAWLGTAGALVLSAVGMVAGRALVRRMMASPRGNLDFDIDVE